VMTNGAEWGSKGVKGERGNNYLILNLY
jgi:hypothetical protein